MEDAGNDGELPPLKPFENSGNVLQPTIVQDYRHTSGNAGKIQTFDHNHGFSEPVQHPYSGGPLPVQQFDYGHGSYDYSRQPEPGQDVAPMLPGAQVFDYSTGNNHFVDPYMSREQPHRDKPEIPVLPQSLPDFSSLTGELLA